MKNHWKINQNEIKTNEKSKVRKLKTMKNQWTDNKNQLKENRNRWKSAEIRKKKTKVRQQRIMKNQWEE